LPRRQSTGTHSPFAIFQSIKQHLPSTKTKNVTKTPRKKQNKTNKQKQKYEQNTTKNTSKQKINRTHPHKTNNTKTNPQKVTKIQDKGRPKPKRFQNVHLHQYEKQRRNSRLTRNNHLKQQTRKNSSLLKSSPQVL